MATEKNDWTRNKIKGKVKFFTECAYDWKYVFGEANKVYKRLSFYQKYNENGESDKKRIR